MPDYTTRGVPFALGTDPNDLTLHTQALAEWVDAHPGVSALTTAQRDALTGAELWEGRVILNLTSGLLEKYDAAATVWRSASVADHGALSGLADDDHPQYLTNARHDTTARHGSTVVDHGQIGGLGDDDHPQYYNADRLAALGLLGALDLASYVPAVSTTLGGGGSTLTAWLPYDTANLRVSFVAPLSGRVLVVLSAVLVMAAGNGSTKQERWRLQGTDGTEVAGAAAEVWRHSLTNTSDQYQQTTLHLLVEGLTPDTAYTWDWAGVGHGSIVAGPLPGGPAIMEVYSL